jgi:transposase
VAGELHRVAVPSVAEEALRDLVRAREDVRGDLMRARHRLAKLLLRHDIRFDGPERNWTQAHLRWLSGVAFEQPGSQRAFGDYFGGVHALLVRRGQLESDIAELLPQAPWASVARRLMCLRGIDTLSAAGLCAEIGDFSRFRHPAQVMSYLGVTPSEHSSGSQRRLGPITKSGSQHARAGSWSRPHGTVAARLVSAPTCAAARPTPTRRSSRSHGRPNRACIACGRGWSSAASAGRSSPSPLHASSPGFCWAVATTD